MRSIRFVAIVAGLLALSAAVSPAWAMQSPGDEIVIGTQAPASEATYGGYMDGSETIQAAQYYGSYPYYGYYYSYPYYRTYPYSYNYPYYYYSSYYPYYYSSYYAPYYRYGYYPYRWSYPYTWYW